MLWEALPYDSIFHRLWDEVRVRTKGHHKGCDHEKEMLAECNKANPWYNFKWRPCKEEYDTLKYCNWHVNNSDYHSEFMNYIGKFQGHEHHNDAKSRISRLEGNNNRAQDLYYQEKNKLLDKMINSTRRRTPAPSKH